MTTIIVTTPDHGDLTFTGDIETRPNGEGGMNIYDHSLGTGLISLVLAATAEQWEGSTITVVED